VLPIDDGLAALCGAHGLVVVIEDGVVVGGIGSAVSRELRRRGAHVPVCDIALPHSYLEQGKRAEVLARGGLSAQEIARRVVEAAASAESDPVAQR
jgi:1-deoxy-D-xylulose-5-phosphate synthase